MIGTERKFRRGLCLCHFFCTCSVLICLLSLSLPYSSFAHLSFPALSPCRHARENKRLEDIQDILSEQNVPAWEINDNTRRIPSDIHGGVVSPKNSLNRAVVVEASNASRLRVILAKIHSQLDTFLEVLRRPSSLSHSIIFCVCDFPHITQHHFFLSLISPNIYALRGR